MTIRAFARNAELLEQGELEKLRMLAFYNLRAHDVKEFGRAAIGEWFDAVDLPAPNVHRLYKRAAASNSFLKGRAPDTLRLHPRDVEALEVQFPGLAQPSDDVEPVETIIPLSIVDKTRGFIESLAKQINASYANNIFDGCAVLMRRLLEVLLVLAYEADPMKEANIQRPDGSYISLNDIIGDVESGKGIKLSKDSKDLLDHFRMLGNFSAHKIYYICRRNDIDRVALNYRATIEELLFVAKLKV